MATEDQHGRDEEQLLETRRATWAFFLRLSTTAIVAIAIIMIMLALFWA